MQIVINIPIVVYDEIINFNDANNTALYEAIRNGTPLPKGCGRLIDAKALEDAMYHEAFEVDSDMQKWDSGNWIRYKMFENAIHNAPTIIDKER